MLPTPQMTRDEAEAEVLAFEDRIRARLRHYSPESFAVEVAKRFRLGEVDDDLMRQHPPHFLVHALEANCAYFEHWRFQPLTDDDFAACINEWHHFIDPVLMGTLKDGTHLFEFVQYMHRTQMEVQGTGSHFRFGRALRIFGDESQIPRAARAFVKQYGIGPRDWLKLLIILHARTGGSRPHKLSPPGIRRQELQSVRELGIPVEQLDRFLAEISRNWRDIGVAYQAVRQAGRTDRQFGPLTWSQRRPTLARFPVVETGIGYLVPAPPLLLRSAGDGLLERFDALESQDARADLGDQFERYVEGMIRLHLPDRRLLTAEHLVLDGQKSCDFALDLPNEVLLVECKSVMLDRELVTERSVINSAAIQRLLDGYVQIIRTADRIRSGGYPADLISRDKPIVGLVATLGNVPGADNGAVRDAVRMRLDKEGIPQASRAALLHPPQPFDAEALEYLILLIHGCAQSPAAVFAEKLSANPWQVGDWPIYLNRRMIDMKPFDLTYWREPFERLLAEMGARNT